MSWYCGYVADHPLHRHYHDCEYGFPLSDETALFERFALEINQAGLSWDLMLRKRETLNRGYDGFVVDTVAAYGEEAFARLMSDPGVIRNRLKIRAVIHNAGVFQRLRDSHGGFDGWLRAHHPRRLEDWCPLFKRQFRFTGGEIVNELLMSTGYLPFAHSPDCPVGQGISTAPWQDIGEEFYR